MSEEKKLKIARWIFCVGGLGVVVLRLGEYYFLGDWHHGYALAWIVHALVTVPIALWFIRREEKKIQLARKG